MLMLWYLLYPRGQFDNLFSIEEWIYEKTSFGRYE